LDKKIDAVKGGKMPTRQLSADKEVKAPAVSRKTAFEKYIIFYLKNK
jgi:hypothetical protein